MYLIDTNIIFYFVRNNPLKNLYRSEMESAMPLSIFIQTFAESHVSARHLDCGNGNAT
jgi:predicted nucleic acid-binding protein